MEQELLVDQPQPAVQLQKVYGALGPLQKAVQSWLL